ncbi:unknown protein [Microcystis aeruginosa NIES-843]|uniref:Uncharacterized protein n=1 Tax=Microcystis aeruginosa (strain NIES-843 / IAM M-2473) TaxID=449447 RepID=B0JQR3_MICAN|nr:unknown protein [Microcystis aeruginosa NIES-843]
MYCYAVPSASHLNPQLQSMCMVRSPKIDRWSSRSHIRERTLQDRRSHCINFSYF